MGLIAFVYGAFAVLSSDNLLKVIGLYVGLAIAVTGLVYVVVAFYNRRKKIPFSSLMIEGCVILLLGIFITFYSQYILKFFVFLIGLWLLLMGVFMLFAAIRNATVINRNLYLVSAVVSVIVGVVFVINPFESLQFITRLSGVFSIAFGVLVMVFSFNLREVVKQLTSFQEAEIVEN